MRNIFLLVLTLSTLTVSGQNHLFGVKGGVNWTEVTASNFANDRNHGTGLAIGLTYDYLFKNDFLAGVDIIYNQRGFTNDVIFTDNFGNPTGERATSTFCYDYISVSMKVGFMRGKTLYGFANIGLTPSVLVYAVHTTPTIDVNGTEFPGESLNLTDKVNKFDIGGLVELGGGYKFKDRYWLYSSFSFQHSFTTITNANYFANSEIRHYGMLLSLGLKYALTKG